MLVFASTRLWQGQALRNRQCQFPCSQCSPELESRLILANYRKLQPILFNTNGLTSMVTMSKTNNARGNSLVSEPAYGLMALAGIMHEWPSCSAGSLRFLNGPSRKRMPVRRRAAPALLISRMSGADQQAARGRSPTYIGVRSSSVVRTGLSIPEHFAIRQINLIEASHRQARLGLPQVNRDHVAGLERRSGPAN